MPSIPFANSGPAYFVVLIVLAIASGRLLGARLSLRRRLAAAFVGTVVGVVVFYAASLRGGPTPDVGLTFGAPALLATMLVLVLLELIGPVPWSAPLRLLNIAWSLRTLRRTAARWTRYCQVALIATRNGTSAYLRPRVDPRVNGSSAFGRSLRRTLSEAGGIFVKLGQWLSTRADVLPASVIAELATLQDDVLAVPLVALKPVLVEDLGARATELIAAIEDQPLAAASIAQVHRALLRNEMVVVKIQRPTVASIVERDADIIRRLGRQLESRAGWAREIRLGEIADGFANAVVEELDFRIEAANIEALRPLAMEAGVVVPRVYREFSTERVLTLEYLDGTRLRGGTVALDALGVDRRAVARALLGCLMRQILITGVFHADPHPGNVLILPDGRPALLDFGSVGRLDAAQQSALRRALVFLDRRDSAQLRDALCDLAEIHDLRRQELLERALSSFMAQRLGPGMSQGTALFSDLLRMLIVDFHISLSPHVTSVFRSLVTLEGTLELLDPDFRIVDEAKQLATGLFPELVNARTIKQTIRDEALSQLPVLRRLPRRVDQLMASVERGDVRVHVELFDSLAGRALVREVTGRATLAFVGAAFGVMALILMGMSGGPEIAPSLQLFDLLGYVGLSLSAIVLLRVLVGVARLGDA